MVIKVLAKLRRRTDENMNFNKDTENIRKFQTEVPKLKSTVTELKDTSEILTADNMRQKKRSVNSKTGHRSSPNQSSKNEKE